MRIAVCHVALCAAVLLPVRAAWAWGAGHDTVARCVLEKLPAAWKSRFRPEWRPAFLAAAHLPDNGDARVLGPDELSWLRENGGLGASLYALHAGPPVYGEIERLVDAIRADDAYRAFVYLASLSHALADGAACNHDPIVHLLTYTWSVRGSPQGRGLPVLPKTGRAWPVDFSFVEFDAETKAVLSRRLEALVVPEPPADITPERLFALVDRWDVLSMECCSRSSGRIVEAGAKWVGTGDAAAKREAADALCDLGLWAVERTLYVFKAAQALAARPDFASMPLEAKRRLFARKATNEVEILRRPMANDSFARPYFAEPGRPSRVRVLYSPIDHMDGSVFDVVSRPIGCQIVGSLKSRRPGLNASLMDARQFAAKGVDAEETPALVVFRRVCGYRGFDVAGFERNLRRYVAAGGKVVWINGEPPAWLIGADVLRALRDAKRRDGYCDPKYPVPLDALARASVAWTGPGAAKAWTYVNRPLNTAGWHWVGSPQWFDVPALPPDAVPLIELRTPERVYLTGVACGGCAYLPLNALYPYCLTDEGPALDPFFLRLDSAGEAVLLSTLDVLLGGADPNPPKKSKSYN